MPITNAGAGEGTKAGGGKTIFEGQKVKERHKAQKQGEARLQERADGQDSVIFQHGSQRLFLA